MAEKIKLSETEKSRFVYKYYGKTEERRGRHQKSCEKDGDWPRENFLSSDGRATPKRQREIDDSLLMGERKKQKTKLYFKNDSSTVIQTEVEKTVKEKTLTYSDGGDGEINCLDESTQ